MKSKMLIALAVLVIMGGIAHGAAWLCGGWVKVDTTAAHNGTPVWINGVAVTSNNGWNCQSVDGTDYTMNPPQNHAGYFLLSGTPNPPARPYTASFMWGHHSTSVDFFYNGQNGTNLGVVVLPGPKNFCSGTVTYGLHAPYQPAVGATVTCSENGWTTTTDASGHFSIWVQGYKPHVGTYHINIVKTPGWSSGSVSFSYDRSDAGANAGTLNLRPVD